jgi:DNA helicase-2/ATP-dependent DNA helicase PcrA
MDEGTGWERGGWGRIRPGLEPLRPERLPDLAVPERPPLPEVELGSGTFSRGGAETGRAAADAATVTDALPTLAWSAGDRVRHRRFGEGIVVSSAWVSGDEEVTVAFVGQGVRRLIGSYAGLERVSRS